MKIKILKSKNKEIIVGVAPIDFDIILVDGIYIAIIIVIIQHFIQDLLLTIVINQLI